MAHLGNRVAAYVDGQLTLDAAADARDHLLTCDECQAAVRQQHLLKRRMTGLNAAPAPSASLLSSLADLDQVRSAASCERSLRARAGRVLRAPRILSLVAITGASVTVTAVAYAAGAPVQDEADVVNPPVEQFVQQFAAKEASATRVSRTGSEGGRPQSGANEAMQVGLSTPIPDRTLKSLARSGWPCHGTLAQDLERVEGAWVRSNNERVVTLTYTNGVSTLTLFEQSGSLDRAPRDDFESASIGGAQVWIRPGTPTIAMWDESGVVYTVVTNASRERLEQAIVELPQSVQEKGHVARVGRGLERLTRSSNPLRGS